ncbi:MAG: hypothetical protein ACEPOV_02045 [Hyphomicrobiales bacterium]
MKNEKRKLGLTISAVENRGNGGIISVKAAAGCCCCCSTCTTCVTPEG